MTEPTPQMTSLKESLKTIWSSGDYGKIAAELRDSSEEFIARIPISPGERLIDIGCGTGQVAIPAARRGAEVTGIDIAVPSIAAARERAAADGLDIRFDVGDAEALPYEDGRFDIVVSLIGAMFAPDPDRTAEEMLRVCRPLGRIVMGNWTPDGFIGRMFRTVAAHAPPPEMPSPLLWDDPQTVRARLGPGCAEIACVPRWFRFHYPFGATEVVEHYATYFGPIRSALARLGPTEEAELRADLEALWREANRAQDGSTLVDAEILEVVATRSA